MSFVTGEKKAHAAIDGRHARAERTRQAIVDALLELLAEGDLKPSADRVAERAKVSRRVIFQHFKDLEDLLTQASFRRFEFVKTIFPKAPTEGPLHDRIRMFVASLGRFYDEVSPVRRAGLLAAYESKVVEARMGMATVMHRETTQSAFAEDIAKAPENTRERLLRGLAGATSFSTWDELRRNQGLTTDEAIAVIVRFVEGLVSADDFK